MTDLNDVPAEPDVPEEDRWMEELRRGTDATAASDPKLERMGAAQHRYQTLPPLGEARTLALEKRIGAKLPGDLRAFVRRFSSGGVGPYYGMFPIEKAPILPAPEGAPWTRSLGLIHAGCGYMLAMPLDGENEGQIWMHADSINTYFGVTSSFSELYAGWRVFMEQGEWLPEAPPEGECSVPDAFSNYFRSVEEKLGVGEDELSSEQVADALAGIPAHAIKIGSDDSPIFEPEDAIDPCQTCVQLLLAFQQRGLRRDALVPGATPIPSR